MLNQNLSENVNGTDEKQNMNEENNGGSVRYVNNTTEVHKDKESSNKTRDSDYYLKNIQNIQTFCADVVQKANSGHPGAPLGLSQFAYILYTEFLNLNPDNPRWNNRDIFVLSNGHSCVIQYVMNHLLGFLTLEDMKAFRQLNSNTPGHPERNLKGIEISTGPLGQGVAASVGYAISSKILQKYGFNNKIYCIFGDGCYQEGISQEAFSLCSKLNLNNITFIYDFNLVTIDGPTELSMKENVKARFESLNFEVIEIRDEREEIRKALKIESSRPKMIILHTVIGKDSELQGTSKCHGNPLGEENIEKLKTKFSLPLEKFYLTEELKESFLIAKERMRSYVRNNTVDVSKISNEKLRDNLSWNRNETDRSVELSVNEEEKTKSIKEKGESNEKEKTKNNEEKRTEQEGKLSCLEDKACNEFNLYNYFTARYKNGYESSNKATRIHLEDSLNSIDTNTLLLSGCADLLPSIKTQIEGTTSMNETTYEIDSYIHYGIREHAMFGIMNGIASHGVFTPMGGTFLNFSAYGMASIKLACMDKLKTLYIFTHDSIGLGEDGPTHQAIESLATLRAIPNLLTLRPCDGRETRSALAIALKYDGPSALILTRQSVPDLQETMTKNAIYCSTGCSMSLYSKDVEKGGYFLIQAEKPEIIILATGSEVHLALEVREILKNYRISVVSMISFELFEKQSEKYKNSVIPERKLSQIEKPFVVSIEALSTFGWAKYSDFQIGMDSFGRSAPTKDVFEFFGFTAKKISKEIIKKVGQL